MSQDSTVNQHVEVDELEALAAHYESQMETYARASALLRRFVGQLGILQDIIDQARQYDVDGLPETLQQKLRSLVERTMAVEHLTSAPQGKASKQPKKTSPAGTGGTIIPAKVEYNPQPIARRKLVQVFVDHGAPVESLGGHGPVVMGGIRGAMYGLYHYRVGTPYQNRLPSQSLVDLADQLGLVTGGGDDDRWNMLVQSLQEQGVLSAEDVTYLQISEKPVQRAVL